MVRRRLLHDGGSTSQASLARLTAAALDTTVLPSLNGPVNALLRQGTTLYVVGNFSTINGQARGGGAAFDVATGTLLAWNPQLDVSPAIRAANAIAITGSTVFIGGSFTAASGTARLGLAAVDATSGALLGTPLATLDPSGFVSTLLLSGTTLYVGGRFTTVGGMPRANLAAIDTASGAVLPLQSNPDGDVRSLLLDAGQLYVGGLFTLIGGQPRSNLGRVDATTGLADSWSTDPNGIVTAMLRVGSTLYVGGGFSVIAGQPRVGAAALSASTGVALGWNPGLGGGSVTGFLDTAAGLVTVGGFTHIGAISRPGVAAIDIVTNELLPLHITVDGSVRSVTPWGDALYLSGSFTRVNGETRNGFAAVNRFSGELLAWNPSAAGSMGFNFGGNSVALRGGRAYVGGYFTSIGGEPPTGLAEVDAITGAVTAFAGDTTGGAVHKLVTDGQTLYVGGTFTAIGGQARQSLAAYDLTTATPTLQPLSVTLAGGTTVLSMKISGSSLYFGGLFGSVNGQPRGSAAALALPGGDLLPFSPGVSGAVRDIDVMGSTVYVAGTFSFVNGDLRRSFAAVDAATGKTTLGFTPSTGSGNGVKVMAFSEGLVAAGSTLQPSLLFFPAIGVGGLPGRPTAPQASLFPQGLFMSWGPPAVGGAPTSYVLEVGTAPGLSNVAAVPTADTSFSYQDALPQALFYARVRAVSDAGIGEASPEIAFATGTAGCGGIAGAPTPMAMVSGDTVTIAWSDPLLFPGALSFSLDAGTASGIYNIGRINVGASHQFSTAAPPGAYFVRVAATGPCGIASPSSELLISVGGVLPLSAPVLSAQVSGGNVSINWTAVSGATAYELGAGFGPLDAPIRIPVAGTSLNVAAPPGLYYLRVRAIGGPTGTSSASNEVVLVVP